jgi:hypothetical protein
VPGKGVGLASVKSIIETYNGTIWVESELGKGSTFRFTINGKFIGAAAPAQPQPNHEGDGDEHEHEPQLNARSASVPTPTPAPAAA